MKKIILVTLMAVMVATPCFAQEIEPEGIFSLHGTEWQALPTGVKLLPLPPSLEPLKFDSVFNFYGGRVYPEKGGDGFYLDMLVCSIFHGYRHRWQGGTYRWFGVLQPIGIGIVAESFVYYSPPYFTPLHYELRIGLLIKASDNWAPPTFGSISPSQGEQGTILTDVQLTCFNTKFDTVDTINFWPGEGIEIHNSTVISDSQITFDLTIAADAPTGWKDVEFWYGDDNGDFQYLHGDQAFEVIEKTN